jgi:hypothetical protein
MCGVREGHVPLPGHSVSTGTLTRNYGATNAAPTQKDQPPPLIEKETPFPNT